MTDGTARRAALKDRLRRARDAGASMGDPALDVIEADHPLARAFGLERARNMLRGAGNDRQLSALRHRDAIERMSGEGRLVREIAAALKLSYSHVVAVRAQLGVGRKR